MRRAAVKALVFRARRMLVAMSLVALLVLVLTLAAPVAAQEETTAQTVDETQAVKKDKDASSDEPEQSVQEGGPQTEDATEGGDEQAADPLEGQTANITADSVGPIAVAGCKAVADETASITVADADTDDATEEVFTDGEDSVFRFGQQGITITADGGGNLDQVAGEFEIGTGEVTDSSGITCGRDDPAEADPVEADPAEGDAKAADELQDLSCDELLVLFRAESSSGQQYGDASGFADSEVRAQIEVCLEEEIVEGTAADGDLPDTGGLSLIGLAVLGVVSAAAGLSVIRGGRR